MMPDSERVLRTKQPDSNTGSFDRARPTNTHTGFDWWKQRLSEPEPDSKTESIRQGKRIRSTGFATNNIDPSQSKLAESAFFTTPRLVFTTADEAAPADGTRNGVQLGAPFLMSARDPTLPPTPPSNSSRGTQNASDSANITAAGGSLRPLRSVSPQANGSFRLKVAKQPANPASIPLSQRSPPTPDTTPPRTTESQLVITPNASSLRLPSSRAESFRTAREYPHSTDDEGSYYNHGSDDISSSGFEYLEGASTHNDELGLGLEFERHGENTPVPDISMFDSAGDSAPLLSSRSPVPAMEPVPESAPTPEPTVEQERTRLVMPHIPNREWNTELMRTVSSRRPKELDFRSNTHPLANDSGNVHLPVSDGTRELNHYERIPRRNSARVSSAPTRLAAGPRNTEKSETTQTFARRESVRASSSSIGSAVVEAIVIESPRRDQRLRHSSKTLNLRSKMRATSEYSPSDWSLRDSFAAPAIQRQLSSSERRHTIDESPTISALASGALSSFRKRGSSSGLAEKPRSVSDQIAYRPSQRNTVKPDQVKRVQNERPSTAPEDSNGGPFKGRSRPRRASDTRAPAQNPDDQRETRDEWEADLPSAPAPPIAYSNISDPLRRAASRRMTEKVPPAKSLDGQPDARELLEADLPAAPPPPISYSSMSDPLERAAQKAAASKAAAIDPRYSMRKAYRGDNKPQVPLVRGPAPVSETDMVARDAFARDPWSRREGGDVEVQESAAISHLRQSSNPNPPLLFDSSRREVDTTLSPNDRSASLDPSSAQTDEHAMARHSFNQVTPFSQMSELEVSEATAVSIFPHNNHSLLVVQQAPRTKTSQREPSDAQHLTLPSAHSHPIGGDAESREAKVRTVVTEAGAPVIIEPSNIEPGPENRATAAYPSQVDSPLQNPRKPPAPPAFQVIPPTPSSELENRLSLTIPRLLQRTPSNRDPPGAEPPRRSNSLKDRARRYSDTFISPIIARARAQSLSRRSRSHQRRDPHWSHANHSTSSQDYDSDNRLHPFWRPRRFWDDDHSICSSDSDFFYDEGFDPDHDHLPAGGDTSDIGSEPDQTELSVTRRTTTRIHGAGTTLGRRMTRRMSGFAGSGGFLIGNSIGVERSGTNRRRHQVSLPAGFLGRLQKRRQAESQNLDPASAEATQATSGSDDINPAKNEDPYGGSSNLTRNIGATEDKGSGGSGGSGSLSTSNPPKRTSDYGMRTSDFGLNPTTDDDMPSHSRQQQLHSSFSQDSLHHTASAATAALRAASNGGTRTRTPFSLTSNFTTSTIATSASAVARLRHQRSQPSRAAGEGDEGRRMFRGRIPGTKMRLRVQYIGLRGVAARMRERRAEKRRERIRRSIGRRFMVEDVAVA